MAELQPPDSHLLDAALGWLELGNPREAAAELGKISPANRSHADVLELRWLAAADMNDWEAALPVARELLRAVPQRASSWLHHAYALRRTTGGGLAAAFAALLPAADQFPAEPTIPYNLACYTCQLNQLQTAMTWLLRAVKAGDRIKILRMAHADPDLAPLRAEISKIDAKKSIQGS